MRLASTPDAAAQRLVAPDGSSEIRLRARGVAKSFAGVPALIDGRIELHKGSVHALCGGNGAGKSTFLNVLMGIHAPDAGQIVVKGRPVQYRTPAEALADGIAIITQELSALRDMTVAENIFLGMEPRRLGCCVDDATMLRRTAELLARLGFDIDARARMRRLSVAQIQLVEIAKAINRQSDILIMDEPTSAIGERETDRLFDAIRSLQAHGVGIIYVSHRLTDIFSIADSYTVMRDGRFVEAGSLHLIDRQRLISLIVGRELAEHSRHEARPAGPLLLEARGFTAAGQFQDISLSLHQGEILGLYGLMGAGRSEFVNAVYGNQPKDDGELWIEGRQVEIRTPADAIAAGLAIVTEDRKETGLVLTASVRQNISLAALRRFATMGFINGRRECAEVDEQIARFRIKTASRELPVRSLSGGNQQKVVLARCLETGPRILLCDEPTRGVDEGSKREIYAFLASYAARGKAVLFISSEIPELLASADRIVVFRRGRIAGELVAAEATQEELVHLAS